MNLEIIKKAIATNGTLMQQVVAMEEMSELIKELSKSIRGEDNKQNIITEIADVKVCLQELQLIYKLDDETIEKEIDKKVERLKGRLDD